MKNEGVGPPGTFQILEELWAIITTFALGPPRAPSGPPKCATEGPRRPFWFPDFEKIRGWRTYLSLGHFGCAPFLKAPPKTSGAFKDSETLVLILKNELLPSLMELIKKLGLGAYVPFGKE